MKKVFVMTVVLFLSVFAFSDDIFSAIPDNVKNSELYYTSMEDTGSTVNKLLLSYNFSNFIGIDNDNNELCCVYDTKTRLVSSSDYEQRYAVPIIVKKNEINAYLITFVFSYYPSTDSSVLDKVFMSKGTENAMGSSNKESIDNVISLLNKYQGGKK